MTSNAALGSSVVYSGNASSVIWEGRVVKDETGFARYVREVVHPRIADQESGFESELIGLASTGMETRFVEGLLGAVQNPMGWEIGEAIAECALRDDSGRDVCWPWNTVRDRRNPRASLPGADLVGFCREDDTAILLIGEVKTSSDERTPPRVMVNGSSGMKWQLEESAVKRDLQTTLLKWLLVRCRDQPYRDLYKKAVTRYITSEGTDILIVGVLIRDTTPSELDLNASGNYLSVRLENLARVELFAWYLPVKISNWPSLLQPEMQ